jgi:hypothetical protein
MKPKPFAIYLFIFALLLNGCRQNAYTETPIFSSATPPPTPKIELIPVVIGETPSNAYNASLGTWHLENFTMSSQGHISGQLALTIDIPYEIPKEFQDYHDFKDVLFIQVWAYYVWPQFGDMLSKPVGEFIPVRAYQSTDTLAAFNIDGGFTFPTLMLDADGGMPLHHFEVTMIAYRQSKVGWKGFLVKLNYPEIGGTPWRGSPMLNQTVSLDGTFDTQVRGDLNYNDWIQANMPLPTSTPASYPMPVETPTLLPSPTNPYPSPTSDPTS